MFPRWQSVDRASHLVIERLRWPRLPSACPPIPTGDLLPRHQDTTHTVTTEVIFTA